MSISNDQLAMLADIYKLLGDYTRLRIMLVCIEESISVNDLANRLGASQSLISHNLRLLKAAKLVIGTRQNKQIFYEAADGHIRHMLRDMLEHIQKC